MLLFSSYMIASVVALTDTRIKIGVIDTGFKLEHLNNIPLCEIPSPLVHDTNGHGTLVTSLITEHAGNGNYCFYVVKGLPGHPKTIAQHINRLRKLNVKVINYSGGSSEFSLEEMNAISRFINSGGIFVAAAGNEGKFMDENNCKYFPACGDKRIVVVGNTGKTSNTGPHLDSIIDGNNKTAYGIKLSGTSMSTAIQTGIIVKDLLNAKVFKKTTDK